MFQVSTAGCGRGRIRGIEVGPHGVEYRRDPYRSSDMAEGVEVYLHVTPDGLAYSGPGTDRPVDDWFRQAGHSPGPGTRRPGVLYTRILMSELPGRTGRRFRDSRRTGKCRRHGDSKTVAVVNMVQVHVKGAYQERTGKILKKMDAPNEIVQDALKGISKAEISENV